MKIFGFSWSKRVGALKLLVEQGRQMESYTPKPIVFNEDDHFDFDKADYNFRSAEQSYASKEFFDFRMEGEGY